ncbi:Uncharacterised protein [Klebsiella pneumoniae]|uniref:Uncharacterized protein n=1 Tax=Klebsiella pneumoniae TaxID=573 RepID=A0A377ZTD2_KLEPN|nr:Uncharacterised protein [Klebsiella pneumoniae]
MKSPTLCRRRTARQTKQADEYDGDDQSALHLLGVITPFCIPRSGPMRSGLSLPLTASP